MTANPAGVNLAQSFAVVPLRQEHLEQAAALFTANYRAAREHEPSLPSCHQDVGSILPKLSDLAAQAPGVAAIRDGRIAGFLLAKGRTHMVSGDLHDNELD